MLNRYFHIGPLARSVRDIATAFSILQGPDGIDGLAVHAKSAGPAEGPITGQPLRVGWLAEPGFGPVDREVAHGVSDAADLLKDAGCHVEPVCIPLLEQNNYFDPAILLYGAELGRYIRRAVGNREAELHYIGKIYVSSPDPSLAEYIDTEIKVDKLKGAFAGYFEQYDVLLCPVIPFTLPPPGLEEYVVNGEKVPSTHMMRATHTTSSNSFRFPLGPSWSICPCVDGQRSADNRKSKVRFSRQRVLQTRPFFLRRSRRETHLHRLKFFQRTRASPWH